MAKKEQNERTPANNQIVVAQLIYLLQRIFVENIFFQSIATI